MAIVLAFPQQTTYATDCSVQPSGVTGTQITVQFDTMSGNQPNTYGNTLYLWQTGRRSSPQTRSR